MATAATAKLEYESSQTQTAMTTLTDSGDHLIFDSAADLFSKVSGVAPIVRPNGLITGGAVIPAISETNDKVDTASLSCYLAGIKVSVGATTDKTVTRGTNTDTHIINSITVTSLGAIAVVAGTASTAFSATRGAAGGPPLIAVGSIEIAQVKLTSTTAAAVSASEIEAIPGTSLETYDFPLFEVNYETGTVTFESALPLSHTGSVTKKVYASYAEPVFSKIAKPSEFVAPEQSYSSSSTQIYDGTVGSSAKSLGQGSFNAFLTNGITDPLLAQEGKNIWFRFYPDKLETAHILCQGVFGITTSFPAGDNISAKCTISAESAAVRRAE